MELSRKLNQAALEHCAHICPTCEFKRTCDRSDLGECSPSEREYNAFLCGAESPGLSYGVNDLAWEIHRAAVKKGFYEEPRECGTRLMLVVSELSEALEADRTGRHADLAAFDSDQQPTPRTGCDPFADKFETHVKDTFEDEIADALIRLLDYAAANDIDIERHIDLKMRYNELRPHKHGKEY